MQASLLYLYIHYIVTKVILDLKYSKILEIQANDQISRKTPTVSVNIQTGEILIQISIPSVNITGNCSKTKFKIIQKDWNWNIPWEEVCIQKQIVSTELQGDLARKRIFQFYTWNIIENN